MRVSVPPLKLRLLFIVLSSLSPSLFGANDREEATIVTAHPVQLREGPGAAEPVIGTLAPGERVRIVRTAGKERRLQVERSQGTLGWIAPEDLATPPSPLSDPPAPAEPQTLETLRQELALLQADLAKAQTASIEILRIQAERDQLQREVIHLKRELDRLRQENSALDADETQVWFLMGGAILFGGILLGILLPRLHLRRRNHWGSF